MMVKAILSATTAAYRMSKPRQLSFISSELSALVDGADVASLFSTGRLLWWLLNLLVMETTSNYAYRSVKAFKNFQLRVLQLTLTTFTTRMDG